MVRLSLVMSVSAMLLAACGESPSTAEATSPEADTPSAVQAPADERIALDGDLVISTNEPFWQARLEGETVVLTGIDAPERRLAVAASALTSEGQRITARDGQGEVVLLVRRMRCQDDMSGARFPMTGHLTIDGRGPFRGCARPASMPAPGERDAGAAVLPEAFVGRWDADAAACSTPGASDLGLTITPDRLRFHESVASPGDVERLDADTVRASFEFEGEGERWQATHTLRLQDAGNTLTLEGPDGPGVVRVRCTD